MRQTTFIWDLDGTLIDSYDGIFQALEVVYQKYELFFDKDWVTSYAIEQSIGDLLVKLSQEHAIDLAELRTFFTEEQRKRDDMIKLMPGAKAVLKETYEKGIQHFIYTHKGSSTKAVLKDLGIATYFTEVITSADGFKRKPDPEGVDYLIEKYQLDKSQTYYIGDRLLDMEVAKNSGIHSINLRVATSAGNTKIEHLTDIISLLNL